MIFFPLIVAVVVTAVNSASTLPPTKTIIASIEIRPYWGTNVTDTPDHMNLYTITPYEERVSVGIDPKPWLGSGPRMIRETNIYELPDGGWFYKRPKPQEKLVDVPTTPKKIVPFPPMPIR